MSNNKLINDIIYRLEQDQGVKIWDSQNEISLITKDKLNRLLEDYKKELIKNIGAGVALAIYQTTEGK